MPATFETDVRELIECKWGLSKFDDIREVEQTGHLVEVRGAIAVNRLSEVERAQAAPFAVDGFVYMIEVYDVSVEGDCEFHSHRFEADPVLA